MSSLFDDQIRVALLGSGSRGNCTWIGNRQHGVLIDCGITTRQVLVRMEALGLSPMAIDAVLVTPGHSDPVSAARVLCNRLFKLRGHRVPFYMTDGTARCLHERIQPSQIMRVSPGERIEIGSLVAEAFRVPHDGMDTIAWAVQSGALRAGVITDLGRSTRLVEEKLASLDIAVLEFNHDLDMLMNGTYAWSLKQRIRSGKGHLSNAQAAGMLRRGCYPSHAAPAAARCTSKLGGRTGRALSLHRGPQQRPQQQCPGCQSRAGRRG